MRTVVSCQDMDLDFGVNSHNYGDHYEYDDNGSDHFVGSEE